MGTKLTVEQRIAWDKVRKDLSDSQALREAMRLYCEVYHVEFPIYDTGGRGGNRRGRKRYTPKRIR